MDTERQEIVATMVMIQDKAPFRLRPVRAKMPRTTAYPPMVAATICATES